MEAGGWRLVVAVQCNLVVILIGIGHRLIHLCIILVCNSDMAVVLISHSDVNNTISNGLFYVWRGKYIYESKGETIWQGRMFS